MADPLSITVSVVALIRASAQAGILLRQFCIDVGGVHATLTGLLADVAGFQQVLECMRETFELDDIKANLTGHAGNHWKNLAQSLQDVEPILQELTALLEGVNKSVSFLNGPRKVVRLKSATDQIATYRDHIQTYRWGLQLSLTTVLLTNQVHLRNAAENMPDRIILALDKHYEEIRRWGIPFNAKIEIVENEAAMGNDTNKQQLTSMKNLRECVRSAAVVVSSASSTLTGDIRSEHNISMNLGSDFGDVFDQGPNEALARWVASESVYEDETGAARLQSDVGDEDAKSRSDSDTDIENDMIKSLLGHATRLKNEGDLSGAERKLRSCLSLASSRDSSDEQVTKMDILERLVDIYWLMESWSNAKTTLKQKMSLTERKVSKNDDTYLLDIIRLASLMLKEEQYVAANLQARKALKGFKRLGESGFDGYEQCLTLLIQICRSQGKSDEEEAYLAMREDQLAKRHALAKVKLETNEVRKSISPNDSKDKSASTHITPSNQDDGLPEKNQVDQQRLASPLPTDSTRSKSPPETLRLHTTTTDSSFRPEKEVTQLDMIKGPKQVQTEFDMLETQHLIPVAISAFYRVLYQTASIWKSLSLQLELLTKYGEILYGRKPQFSTYYDRNGWSCLVLLDDTHSVLVSDFTTENLAKEAAVSQACQQLIPEQIRELDQNGGKLHDPYSDKVFVSQYDAREYERLVKPDLIVAVDFGMQDTAVAYYAQVNSLRISWIQRWPGRSQANENRVPSIVAYRKATGESKCGFAAILSSEAYSAEYEVIEFFKFLLDEKILAALRLKHADTKKVPSLEDVMKWHCDYFQDLYKCISNRLHHDVGQWMDARIDFTFSFPATWKGTSSMDHFQNCIHRAGFTGVSNHRASFDLSEPEVAISNATLELGLAFNYDDIVVACEIGQYSVEVSAWHYAKSPSPSARNVHFEKIDATNSPCGGHFVDTLFENAVLKRLQEAEQVAPMTLRDLHTTAWQMRLSMEFRNAIEGYGNEDSLLEPEHWTVCVPLLDKSYVDKEHGIQNGEMLFTRTEMISWLGIQLEKVVNIIDRLLERVKQKLPSQQVTHLILYGDSNTLHYAEKLFRAYYGSVEGSEYPDGPIQVSVVSDAKLGICKGLVREQMERYKLTG